MPPALRAQSTDSVKLARLKRQMQGLMNRVAESNMASVASQIEQIIAANSRGDSNEVLAQLLHALAPAGSVTPARMVAEHILLLALLHAHLGADIGNSILKLLRFSLSYILNFSGAAFLQSTVEKFDSEYKVSREVENKTLNNFLQILCFMYCFKVWIYFAPSSAHLHLNFQMFHCTLLFGILDKLAVSFEEKDVELILLVLKTVGPTLRKDDPAALKDFIIQVQKQASSCSVEKYVIHFSVGVC